MVLIQRMAYINLLQGGTLDIVVSPQQPTISALLGHIRKGDIGDVVSLRHGEAEALEIIVHGESHSSNVIERKISDIKLPPTVTIGAILRDEEIIIARKMLSLKQMIILLFILAIKTSTRGRKVVPTKCIFYLI